MNNVLRRMIGKGAVVVSRRILFVFGRMLILGGLMINGAYAGDKMCTFSTYEWNVEQRKAVNFREVRKQFSELSSNEVESSTGCSICREDQVELKLPGVAAARVCKYVKDEIEASLLAAINNGFEIQSLVGYRAGKTRGVVDADGNRTKYSNHSFGSAVDVNSENNGLYADCINFGGQCRLIKGGEWSEDSSLSINSDGVLVDAMKRAGFKWGGEILGKQKDFMHFSKSGY